MERRNHSRTTQSISQASIPSKTQEGDIKSVPGDSGYSLTDMVSEEVDMELIINAVFIF